MNLLDNLARLFLSMDVTIAFFNIHNDGTIYYRQKNEKMTIVSGINFVPDRPWFLRADTIEHNQVVLRKLAKYNDGINHITLLKSDCGWECFVYDVNGVLIMNDDIKLFDRCNALMYRTLKKLYKNIAF